MPSGTIPFGAPVNKSQDESMLSDGNSLCQNGYTRNGVTYKRAGFSSVHTLPLTSSGPVDALFWWGLASKNNIIAVVGGRTYTLSKVDTFNSAVLALVSVDNTSAILRSKSPRFAYDQNRFYISDGGGIKQSNGTATSLAALTDPQAPTSSTHIGFLDSYIIGNESGTRQFKFSAVGDGLAWDALDLASAIGAPDEINALAVYDRKLFLFGPESLEVWQNDGENPFSRIDGGYYDVGCLAPSSILKTKSGLYWMDGDRNIVFSSGGFPEVISNEYKREIDTFQNPSDCEMQYFEIDGSPLLVLNFQTDNRSLVYNLVSKDWSEFSFWSDQQFKVWAAKSYCWAPAWGAHIVGSRYENNAIYQMSHSYYSDNGSSIRFLKRTGFINHGSDTTKRNNKITLRVRRGFGSVTTPVAPKLMLRWRDDGANDWSNIMEVNLGKAGDTTHHIEVSPRGIYRSRQWELSCSDNVPLAFLDATEDYSILR